MIDEANKRTETKYAVCHSVNSSAGTANVKIQGSDEEITCSFPRNQKGTPQWLRTGSAVQLRHTGGNRGKLEIFDRSIIRPTPQAGSDPPTIPTPTDAIIRGLQLVEISNRDVMKAAIATGYVRFSGTTSSYIYVEMTSPARMTMGYGLKMGAIADVVTIDTAPVSGARYDLVVIGSDLVFDVVKGTASSTPSLPDIPANHLLCGWILVNAGVTSIKRSAFNQNYSVPILTSLTVVAADNTLDWGESNTTITITAYDQYGNTIVGPGSGWYVTLTIEVGNGTVDDQLGNSSTTSVSKYMGASATTIFGYTRDQASSDNTPTLQATVQGYYATGATVIVLLDASGDPM